MNSRKRDECELKTWILDLTLPLTGAMNLFESCSFSASLFLLVK